MNSGLSKYFSTARWLRYQGFARACTNWDVSKSACVGLQLTGADLERSRVGTSSSSSNRVKPPSRGSAGGSGGVIAALASASAMVFEKAVYLDWGTGWGTGISECAGCV